VLFDERPKVNRSDLFDRERELNELKEKLDKPLLLLTGIRRIGKTSVLNVFLNESKTPFILIDARSLKRNYSVEDLYKLIARSLSSSLSNIYEVLKNIKRIKILGNEIEIAWRGKDYVSLSELFDELNSKRVIVAVDEAQLLRGPNSIEIKNAIAHSYDYNRNITFILTGSEAGLLYQFLGIKDQNSPLFGRSYHEVKLERFDKETSKRFLEKGFSEANFNVEQKIIDEAVDEFDGIVGWLTYFGSRWISGLRDINEVKKIAISIAKSEIINACRGRSTRLLTALKCIAKGSDSWSSLRSCIESVEGRTISSSVLDNVIRSLEDLSLIKAYSFLDKIYAEAAKEV